MHLVFCSLPNFIFYLKLPCITIYKLTQTWIKHPCSIRDLGLPHPSFLLQLVPWSLETCRAHFSARAFKTSLRGHPVPLWAVQVLCKGLIGFPHNPRDISLSLLLSFRWLRSTRPQSVKKTSTDIIFFFGWRIWILSVTSVLIYLQGILNIDKQNSSYLNAETFIPPWPADLKHQKRWICLYWDKHLDNVFLSSE